MMPCLVLDEAPKSNSKVEYDSGPNLALFAYEEASWLHYQVGQGSNLLLIDCRPFPDYCQAHIEGAISLAISNLMLRRLKKGNMPLANLINSETSKGKFERRGEVERIVIYDSTSKKDTLNNNVLKYLLMKLSEVNRVCFLEGNNPSSEGVSRISPFHPVYRLFCVYLHVLIRLFYVCTLYVSPVLYFLRHWNSLVSG